MRHYRPNKVSGQQSFRGVCAAVIVVALAHAAPAYAQQPPPAAGGWQTAPAAPAAPPTQAQPPSGFNTTIVPRIEPQGAPRQPAAGAPAAADATPHVKLTALLTADGQRIDQGLVWRVFNDPAGKDAKPKLLQTVREPSPSLKLPPGDYRVVVSFGRAHLTRKITVKPNVSSTEPFVLNAGGLRVNAMAGQAPATASAVSYNILAGERDQQDNRATVMTGAKPGLIIRLNAGIYHIVSTYGDANATVRADVTVEAGKLTEATVVHNAGKVTFKLVTRQGGEALPGAHWSVQAPDGAMIKESVGALPTHILAPGSYVVTARSDGKLYRRDFAVKSGEVAEVEVLKQ